MSVLDWFSTRFKREASHFLYVPVPADHVRHSAGQTPDNRELAAGNHYFRLWLTQMFLKNDRNWFAGWHPAVHSAVTFEFGSTTQVVTNVTGPSKLQELEGKNLDKFITANQRLTALLPFNGGTVTLDAGLLALQGKNDIQDLVKVLGDFGSLLVVPQLSAAMAVAGPLANAVGSLVGAADGQLMIGLNQTFSSAGGGAEAVLRAGYYAVIDATEDTLQREKFWVDKDQLQYGDSLETSKPLTGRNYLLFRIESRDSRDDWDELKTIQEPYQEVIKMLQAGQVEQAEANLRRAIAAALVAPELTKNVDRRRVVSQLKAKFEQDKIDLGQGAFKRADASLKSLMADAISVKEAASKPEIKAKEAFAGLSW
jgi:hypothetical protein